MTAPTLSVRGTGSYAVFDGSRQVSRWYTSPDAAAARANNLERAALVVARSCMCCGETFNAAGKGNRLCSGCRRHPGQSA